MNNKPQQPRFDPTRLGLPKDIAQVIERLKSRGLVKQNAQPPTPYIPRMQKTPRSACKWCGKVVSSTFGNHHICKPHRLNLKPILLAMLLPLAALAQSKTNVPVVFLDARVSFIQPAGKEAKVYTRKTAKDKWALWQIIPRNSIVADQAVILTLPNPIIGTSQCQVTFE